MQRPLGEQIRFRAIWDSISSSSSSFRTIIGLSTWRSRACKAHWARTPKTLPVPFPPVLPVGSGHRITIGRLWSFSTRDCFRRICNCRCSVVALAAAPAAAPAATPAAPPAAANATTPSAAFAPPLLPPPLPLPRPPMRPSSLELVGAVATWPAPLLAPLPPHSVRCCPYRCPRRSSRASARVAACTSARALTCAVVNTVTRVAARVATHADARHCP